MCDVLSFCRSEWIVAECRAWLHHAVKIPVSWSHRSQHIGGAMLALEGVCLYCGHKDPMDMLLENHRICCERMLHDNMLRHNLCMETTHSLKNVTLAGTFVILLSMMFYCALNCTCCVQFHRPSHQMFFQMGAPTLPFGRAVHCFEWVSVFNPVG